MKNQELNLACRKSYSFFTAPRLNPFLASYFRIRELIFRQVIWPDKQKNTNKQQVFKYNAHRTFCSNA